MRKIVATAAYPLILFGSLGAGMLLLARGCAPVRTVMGINAAAVLAVVLLEQVIPYRRSWNRPRGDIALDAGHLLLSQLLAPLVVRTLLFGALPAAASALARYLGVGLWPSGWPMALQLGLALGVGELAQYWMHRLGHEWRPLWRLHALHHSVPRLYWLNAGRFHALDVATSYLVQVAPLMLAGAPDRVIALFTLFSALSGLLRHANIDMKLDSWNWIFSTADMHRWHHSPVVAEANHNYGANLIVWDIVFGTRFLPADRAPPEELGLANLPRFPTRFVAQLLAPLRSDSFSSDGDEPRARGKPSRPSRARARPAPGARGCRAAGPRAAPWAWARTGARPSRCSNRRYRRR